MSAVALPTKPNGFRPPTQPPIGTSFDPLGDDADEPHYKAMVRQVRLLIKFANQLLQDRFQSAERLLALRRQLTWRRDAIEEELRFERMMAWDSMPPLIEGLYSLDFLGHEDEVVSAYQKAVSTLEAMILEVDCRIAALNWDSAPSDN